jgi:molybdate transport system substrate-binding protein
VPQSLYSPIKQDAILLNNGKHKKEAIDFLSFLASEHVREKLKKFGYVFN